MRHPLRAIWLSMRARCLNTQSHAYRDYGGRGIGIDATWENFEQFCADMGPRPHGMTLERKNNNLGYSKENCMWASRQAQARNRRSSRVITFAGKTQTMIAWAEELGITYMTLYLRLYRRKLPIAEALNPARIASARVGEANNKTKLSNEQVTALRAEFERGGMTQTQLASKYGMSKASVSQIIRRKVWRHVA